MEASKLSPMMQQYKAIKDMHQDAILMFRLGDFYEMFFDDALLASRVLELTLTGRNCGLEEKAPMCGVPHHAVDSYIVRLVKSGYKVAICEQIEDPAECKGIVDRDIVRIYTPGTLDILDASNSNENIYIASIFISNDISSISIADISTGELIVTDFADNIDCDILSSELAVYNPKEIIVNETNFQFIKEKLEELQINTFITSLDISFYKREACENIILNQFNITSLISLGLEDREELVLSTGSLLMYLIDTQKQNPNQLNKLTFKKIGNTMQLDRSTMRNLELLETIYEHDVNGSLLGVLNKTKTAMGARLLKRFLREPLVDSKLINLRLNAVEEIKNNLLILNNISNSLKHVYDFQRLTARIAAQKANARDLIALKSTLAQLPDICNQLDYLNSDLIKEIKSGIANFDCLYTMIESAVCDEPPFSITEGGIIKTGFSKELDDIRDSIKDAKSWISGLEVSEKERTGIKTLKVGYNKVFGYYIDVSKGMIDKVPDDYIRKQTLVNNERYITPELKEKENLVFSAENKINKIEYEVFKELRESIEKYITQLQQASDSIALLDVLISFAKVAIDNNYVKPIVNDSNIINIINGRHPTVENTIGAGMFISNDTEINNEDRSLLIITGPNMSGKSTYMRQTAVIVLMAQMGCFVPAEKAEIGIVDRVFTRIGASDNLSYGQSTFYIEMSELANILRNATSRSLIILDEIGRGTSTFDGLSIAWATVEYLSKTNNRIRTMFATHYHELTDLADTYSNIKNLSVSVAEDGNNVVFLHNIVEGPASKSYGIHVAKIAGVPEEIRENARIKLNHLESNEISDIIDHKNTENITEQLSFYSKDFSKINLEFINKISNIDINSLTPIDAINTLKSLIDQAKGIGDNND